MHIIYTHLFLSRQLVFYASIQPKSARCLAKLTANAFNRIGQHASNPGFAELAVITSAKEVMFCQTLFVCLFVCVLAR